MNASAKKWGKRKKCEKKKTRKEDREYFNATERSERAKKNCVKKSSAF